MSPINFVQESFVEVSCVSAAFDFFLLLRSDRLLTTLTINTIITIITPKRTRTGILDKNQTTKFTKALPTYVRLRLNPFSILVRTESGDVGVNT